MPSSKRITGRAEPHPNRFASYLKARNLNRAQLRADGTLARHFIEWARQVRQRNAIRSLHSTAAAVAASILKNRP